MIILSGTNRPGSNTRIVAERALRSMQSCFDSDTSIKSKLNSVQFLDLLELKADIFDPSCYGTKPAWFVEKYQKPILAASGILIVTPEYNGSLPGVLKYFIDMLKFPESLQNVPVALIGIAAGQFGALRSVEQLETILHYRKVHLFGERLFVPNIGGVLQPDGSLGEHEERFQSLIKGFAGFAAALKK